MFVIIVREPENNPDPPSEYVTTILCSRGQGTGYPKYNARIVTATNHPMIAAHMARSCRFLFFIVQI